MGGACKAAKNSRITAKNSRYPAKFEKCGNSAQQSLARLKTHKNNNKFQTIVIAALFFCISFLMLAVITPQKANEQNVDAAYGRGGMYLRIDLESLTLSENITGWSYSSYGKDNALYYSVGECAKSDSGGTKNLDTYSVALPISEMQEQLGVIIKMTSVINGSTRTYTSTSSVISSYDGDDFTVDEDWGPGGWQCCLVVNVQVIGAKINYYDSDGSVLSTGSHTNGSTTTLYTPTKEGYSFEGWYTSADYSGTPLTTLTGTYSSAVNLYAKWAATEKTINLVGSISCANSMLLLTILDSTGARVAEVGFVTGQTNLTYVLTATIGATYKVLVTKPFGSVLSVTGATQTSSTTYTFTVNEGLSSVTFSLSGNGYWSNTVVI